MADHNGLLIDNPSHLSQRYFNFTTPDYIYLTVFGCALMIVGNMLQNIALGLGIFAVGALFLVKFSNRARLYYDIGFRLKDWKIRKFDRGDIWVKPDPNAKTKKLKKGVEGSIPIEIYQLGEIGLAHNKLHKSVSCVILGTGSDIASLKLESQRVKISRYGDNTKRVASRPQFGVGLNYVYRIDPYNLWKVENERAATDHPEVYIPQYLVPGVDEADLSRDELRRKRLHENGLAVNRTFVEGVEIDVLREGEVIGKAQLPGASEAVMAAVVTIKSYGLLESLMKQASDLFEKGSSKPAKRSRKFKAERAMSEAEAFELPIMDVARTCENGLKANGVGGLKILNSVELEAFMRGVWDIGDKPEFYAKQQAGELGPLDHWPAERICATKKASVFDNTTHSVIRLTNLPSPVPPHFMRQLHALPARYKSISLVGETIRSTGDYLALGRLATLVQSGMEVFGSTGGIKSGRFIGSITSQQEKVSNTTFMQLYSILICVSNVSSPALERDMSNVMKELDGMLGIKVERIEGETQQDRAVWSARGGINML